MFEYTVDLPLWDRTPGPDQWFGPIPRGALDVSADLEERLAAWNAGIEAALGSELVWPSPDAQLDAVVEGFLLAAALQEELGSDTVVLYGDDGGDDPLPSANPAGAERRPLIEQMWAIPDAEFLEMTRGADLAALSWHPGRTPERLLIEPRPDRLPLADRTPLVDRTDDHVAAAALGIEGELLERLVEWNERWRSAPRPLEYRTSGFRLAADVQRAVGPLVTVIFPEASRRNSEPTPEMQAFVDRRRSLAG